MKSLQRLLPLLAWFLLSRFAMAQLPTPNAAGVSAGHDIFVVKDLDAANRFWTTLGAQPASLGGRLNLLKFPGVLFLIRQGSANGGTEGSTVGYLGFKVKDLKASLAKWEAEGIQPLPGVSATEAFLMGRTTSRFGSWRTSLFRRRLQPTFCR